VTWVSTLAVNLNPAMRFDGYYLLCDIFGIDNLQMRAFNFTLWQLRKWLLGLDVPCPEDLVTPKRRWGMIIYSFYTWIYRIFLYTAIAIFVYYEFTKALGIFLFLIEVGVFLLLPIYSELKQLHQFYPFLSINPRSFATLSALGLLLAWFVIPLPHQEKFVAITTPVEESIVYIPQNGIVEKINVKLGDRVNKGDLLIQAISPVLNLQISEKEYEAEIIQSQINVISLNETNRGYIPEKQAELQGIKNKMGGLLEVRNQLKIVSGVKGFVYQWDDTLHVGQSVAKNQVVGKIAPFDDVTVIAFVPEANLHDVREGQEVIFRTKSGFIEVKGVITSIPAFRASLLIYPQLASVNLGDLPVSEEPSQNKPNEPPQNRFVLVESYFPVEVDIQFAENENLRFGESGYLLVEGEWKSRLVTLYRHAQGIFWRESGM